MFFLPGSATPWAVAATLFSVSHLTFTVRCIGPNEESRASVSALMPPSFEIPSQSGGSLDNESDLESMEPTVPRDEAEEDGSYLVQDAAVFSGSSSSNPAGTSSPSVPPVTFVERRRLEGGELAKAKERSQAIAQHKAPVPEGASERDASLLAGSGEATPVPDSDFVAWNPMKGDEPDESEDLKHKGPPKDFVPIPLFDEASETPLQTAEVSQASTSMGSAGSRFIPRWQSGSTGSRSSFSTPISSRWKYGSPSSGGGSLGDSTAPWSGYKHGFDSDAWADSPSSRYSSPYESRWERTAPKWDTDSSLSPPNPTPDSGGSKGRYLPRRERTTPDIPTSPGRSRTIDSGLGGNYYGFPTPRPPISAPKADQPIDTPSPSVPVGNGSSSGSNVNYRGWLPSPVQGSSRGIRLSGGVELSDTAHPKESTSTKPLQSQCEVTVGGVDVDTTYVDAECTGEIHVEYKTKTGQFTKRRLLVTNKNTEPVTVVLKTVNARVSTPPTNSGVSSLLQLDGPASFFEGVSEEEGADATKEYVNKILKQMRRHVRKNPEAPHHPETATEATSFMQTVEGAGRIMQTCDELLSVLKEKTDYYCEVLETVDMVILQFPPTADLAEGGSVEVLLKKLLTLEGKSILFWELSKPTSLQMLPVNTHLPEPPKTLKEKPIFLQAKAELDQQCSAETAAHARLLGGDSPVASRIPKDPDLEDRLWGIYAARCVHAWMHGEKGDKRVLVAVVDSGVSDHIDLDANAWRNPEEIIDGKDNDGNGFVDDMSGWNFSTDSKNIQDFNGHGTHVAGTIGGVANNMAIVGCAPLVSLMKVQQFGATGKGSVGDAVRATAYAALNGAHIINNSWGSTDSTRSLQLVIERSRFMRDGLGILIVSAAGNESTNNDIVPFYPAGHQYENTISVGAYNADGALASFSNYGRSSVTLLAPGERIYSTYPGNSYEFLSGTSMATPHVSGVAALVFGVFMKANSEVRAAEVKDILEATQQKLAAAQRTTQWGGAPDAMAAVLMARMGGMWCQMQCTDMIIDLNPKESYAPALLIRGYENGTYSADINIEVYNKMGQLMGTTTVPFKLNSSPTPAPNTPSDATAATAFSSYVRDKTHANPLCDVQLKYTGTLDGNVSISSMEIVATVLGTVAGVLLLAISGFFLYMYLKKKPPQQAPKKKQEETEEKDVDADANTDLARESSVPRVGSEMYFVEDKNS